MHYWVYIWKKVSNEAKIRNRYNQVPHLPQDTTWASDKNTTKHHIQGNQDIFLVLNVLFFTVFQSSAIDVLSFAWYINTGGASFELFTFNFCLHTLKGRAILWARLTCNLDFAFGSESIRQTLFRFISMHYQCICLIYTKKVLKYFDKLVT